MMPAIRDLDDENLIKEHYYWRYKVLTAKSWGAALAAANEFAQETAQEMRLRDLPILELEK